MQREENVGKKKTQMAEITAKEKRERENILRRSITRTYRGEGGGEGKPEEAQGGVA